MLRTGILLALLGCSPLVADEVALIRVGDLWRCLKGRAEASTPPEVWRQPAFNDLGWVRAPSGFTFDYWGYEASIFAETTRDYNSLYFRRQFVLSKPEEVKWLILRVDYDGGFVAYLNGVEVARRGLGQPSTPVWRDTPAQFHSRGVPEEVNLSGFSQLLTPGVNTLALEWHNSTPIYSAVGFVPELFANFTRGPFVQNTAADHQQVIWKTLVPSDTVVEYGVSPALGLRYADTNLVTTHATMLTNLAPDTLYYYRASSTADGTTASSPVTTFRTLKLAGPLTFVVTADSGMGNVQQYGLAEVMQQAQPDLVLMAGDTVYPSFSANKVDARVFSVYQPLMKSIPFFIAAGNHDVAMGGALDYFDAYYLPTNQVTGTEHYYSFDHGDAHFVSLYVPYMSGAFELKSGSPQLAWLAADLAASTKPWKFLFLHHPLRSSGQHTDDDYNYNGIRDPIDLAALLLPVAAQHGVQMVFSGHDHTYERFNPVQGFYQIVAGGGGGTLYKMVNLDPGSAQFWSQYSLVKVTVTSDTLRLQALDEKGEVFDNLFIQRTPPVPQVYAASWNTPSIEAAAANDGDGNLTQQRFDFSGTPIPTLSGDFSNLGRVYVNYDHTHLYVGLEQAMIGGDNNIFLFLESPRIPGVTKLAGLGNGIVDPNGQGADGLDFLENLSFTNFAPRVACLLGDEYADGQFRAFHRISYYSSSWHPATRVQADLPLDIGQGVFRLDAGFSDVPGARLQQFNRSPQSNSVFGEQNANFIEVAIPLGELGLQAGDQLKLGAVVGGAAFNTNADQQTRSLDRGYLGNNMVGSGQGQVLLEGVTVQLGPDLDPDGDGLLTEQERTLGTDPNQADTDHDGLPDGWEVKYNLDPLSAAGANGPNGDPDGDTITNVQEFRSGTDPRNAASALRLGVTLLPNGPRLSWQAVPGRKYQLQYADSVTNPFANLPAPGFPRVATLALESYDIPDLPANRPPVRFYRVVLVE